MAESQTTARIGIISFLFVALCVSVSLLPRSSEDATGMSLANSLLQKGHAAHNIANSSSSSANESNWQEIAAKLEVKKQLKLCAAKITGDSTPRHLDRAVRAKVCYLATSPFGRGLHGNILHILSYSIHILFHPPLLLTDGWTTAGP